MPASSLEQIVSLAKRRGFVFPSSAVYGGLGSTWDYGPLGVELKNNVKRAWWRSVVYDRDDMEGLDAAILMNRLVWKYSGHEATFSDPMTDCRSCKARPRADHVFVAQKGRDPINVGEINAAIEAKELKCPKCGATDLTPARPFNLMFKTTVGPVDTGDDSGLAYLRPETAQGIFVNFGNILDTMRRKLPFGVAQIGKAFRNEITPGNFTFRTREFEQMEIEYFVKPGEDEAAHQAWIDARTQWYVDLGMRRENLRQREQTKDELAHYAKRCVDLEYRFPMGWSELEGIANRTDYDLGVHAGASGQDLSYLDPETNERYIPYVIEPAVGVDRSMLAFLLEAYTEDEAPDAKGNLERRVVLRLDPRLAPVKVAVLPLSRNADLSPKARDVAAVLRQHWNADFDDASAIGRRYRRQDEIGTPYCVTVDFESLDDQAVTVRERDSMRQERIGIDSLVPYLSERLAGC